MSVSYSFLEFPIHARFSWVFMHLKSHFWKSSFPICCFLKCDVLYLVGMRLTTAKFLIVLDKVFINVTRVTDITLYISVLWRMGWSREIYFRFRWCWVESTFPTHFTLTLSPFILCVPLEAILTKYSTDPMLMFTLSGPRTYFSAINVSKTTKNKTNIFAEAILSGNAIITMSVIQRLNEIHVLPMLIVVCRIPSFNRVFP